MSDYLNLIMQRESCRAYADKTVSHEQLLSCAEAARLSPSACNSQPWKFHIVTEPVLRAKVTDGVQDMGMNKFAASAPVLVVVTEERANLSETVGSRFKKQDFASVDIGLAVSQFCLRATEQGLSTCILGWLNEKKLREALGLPADKRVRLVLCVGYAASGTLREKKRKPLDEIAAFYE